MKKFVLVAIAVLLLVILLPSVAMAGTRTLNSLSNAF